ncbi:hypothetical protein PROFUN_10959 [Planoprotostelium fungivorum]|uniref:CCHC-type domain-containing protein n=1 Tax=Planoprotostelium fungivorum TaxID=1890364 RepID=A0A2P6NBU1_9EUKA|nr:hypothetical protein PROFUN_10959 [Planoprotostelium fungivorum]
MTMSSKRDVITSVTGKFTKLVLDIKNKVLNGKKNTNSVTSSKTSVSNGSTTKPKPFVHQLGSSDDDDTDADGNIYFTDEQKQLFRNNSFRLQKSVITPRNRTQPSKFQRNIELQYGPRLVPPEDGSSLPCIVCGAIGYHPCHRDTNSSPSTPNQGSNERNKRRDSIVMNHSLHTLSKDNGYKPNYDGTCCNCGLSGHIFEECELPDASVFDQIEQNGESENMTLEDYYQRAREMGHVFSLTSSMITRRHSTSDIHRPVKGQQKKARKQEKQAQKQEKKAQKQEKKAQQKKAQKQEKQAQQQEGKKKIMAVKRSEGAKKKETPKKETPKEEEKREKSKKRKVEEETTKPPNKKKKKKKQVSSSDSDW